MSTRISYSTMTPTGTLVAEAADAVRKAIDAVARADDVMTSGMNGDTWTALAGQLGGGISDADAQNTWTIMRNVRSSLEVPALGELNRLDQGPR